MIRDAVIILSQVLFLQISYLQKNLPFSSLHLQQKRPALDPKAPLSS